MESLVISIPQEDVGRIIGKQGAQIKALREQSGCEIVVDTSDKASPVARLKGRPSCVATAKSLIVNICGGNGVIFLRDIDDVILNYLTKQNFLQSQQSLSNVTTELRGRSLKITSQDGNAETAAKFKTLLEEHISKLTESVIESVSCDHGMLRKIRQDANIQQLESTQNLKLNIIKNGSQTTIEFSGQRGTVQDALDVAHIILKSSGEVARDTVQLVSGLFVQCSQQKIADFEADLDEGIALRFDVHAQYHPESTRITLEGPESNVAAAKEETEQLLQYYFNDNCASIYLHPFAVTDICGRQNQNIMSMTRNDLCLSVDAARGRIWICGSSSRAEAAYNRLVADIAEWEKRNVLIPLKDERMIGILTGVRGDVLRKIEETTRAQISIEANIPGVETSRCVWIWGSNADCVHAAKMEIEQLIRSHYNRDLPTRSPVISLDCNSSTTTSTTTNTTTTNNTHNNNSNNNNNSTNNNNSGNIGNSNPNNSTTSNNSNFDYQENRRREISRRQ